MAPTPDHSPRLLHPLMGCHLKTLLQVSRSSGAVAPRFWPHLGLAIATALARLPVTAVEDWRSRQLPEGSQPPIFIVGHWRSGTTFLYELLCHSQQFAYVSPFATGLPGEFLTLGSLLRPLLTRALPADRYIDGIEVTPSSPQEDEIALANLQPLSFYHGLYFPQQLQEHFNRGIFFDDCTAEQIGQWRQAAALFFKKLQRETPDKPLLIKNPVYTARVALLRQMYPQAKFIHIYRNPYVVFQSMRNFYRKLLSQLALQPFSIEAADQLTLQSYPRMMGALLQDVADLPPHQYIQLRFEDFEQDPLAHVEAIYRQLEIPGFDQGRDRFQQYLQTHRRYRKNQYRFPPEDNRQVYGQWHEFVDRWGYRPEG
ncbi:MAG: sulfotransferase [Cyanobacteria bacterium P01_A01_bin.135]